MTRRKDGDDGQPDWDRFLSKLDSGAARVLAAQLIRFADLADLET